MKLLIVLVALVAIGLSRAQKPEHYSFTSRILCSSKDGKRHCVPCSTSNGMISCTPSDPNANNGGRIFGPTVRPIEPRGITLAPTVKPMGPGNIRNNNFGGYSPIYDPYAHYSGVTLAPTVKPFGPGNIRNNGFGGYYYDPSGGRNLAPTVRPIQPVGNNYFLDSPQSGGLQGLRNANNAGSTSTNGGYIDGPDNIPNFD